MQKTPSSTKTVPYAPSSRLQRKPSSLVNFFARVIWLESRFAAHLVGRKGAKGIAQFMPETTDFRGLADPFYPISSIENAARYLGDLRMMLGNLGLAGCRL